MCCAVCNLNSSAAAGKGMRGVCAGIPFHCLSVEYHRRVTAAVVIFGFVGAVQVETEDVDEVEVLMRFKIETTISTPRPQRCHLR